MHCPDQKQSSRSCLGAGHCTCTCWRTPHSCLDLCCIPAPFRTRLNVMPCAVLRANSSDNSWPEPLISRLQLLRLQQRLNHHQASPRSLLQHCHSPQPMPQQPLRLPCRNRLMVHSTLTPSKGLLMMSHCRLQLQWAAQPALQTQGKAQELQQSGKQPRRCAFVIIVLG